MANNEGLHDLWDVNPNKRIHRMRIPPLTLDLEPVYMSEYFEHHPGKPVINIAPGTLAQSYTSLITSLDNQRWSDSKVAAFMYNYIRATPEFANQEDGEWIANAIRINPVPAPGAQPRVRNPMDILEVVLTEEVAGEDGGDDNVRASLFNGLVMHFRKSMAKAGNPEEATAVGEKLHQFFTQKGWAVTEAHQVTLGGFTDEKNLTESYKRIICALDMFFIKFPNHKRAPMRMATLTSRYRGCVAVTSLGLVAKVMGVSPRDLCLFALSEALAGDIRRIAKEGEGMEDPYSYFPYQLDMSLTPKSCYSLSVNPTFCVWIHTIGCLQGYSRSLAAKMPTPNDIGITVASAVVTSITLAGSAAINRKFYTTQESADRQWNRRVHIRQGAEEGRQFLHAPRNREIPEDQYQEQRAAAVAAVEAADNLGPEEGNNNERLSERIAVVLRHLRTHDGLSPEYQAILTRRAATWDNCHIGSIAYYLYMMYGGRRN